MAAFVVIGVAALTGFSPGQRVTIRRGSTVSEINVQSIRGIILTFNMVNWQFYDDDSWFSIVVPFFQTTFHNYSTTQKYSDHTNWAKR